MVCDGKLARDWCLQVPKSTILPQKTIVPKSCPDALLFADGHPKKAGVPDFITFFELSETVLGLQD